MKRQIVMIQASSLALVVVLSAGWQAQTQQAQTAYAKMAPLEQYLIADRDAEIALARSAAPESISHDAEVLVLGRHSYETAVKGKSDFVCMVLRSAWFLGDDATQGVELVDASPRHGIAALWRQEDRAQKENRCRHAYQNQDPHRRIEPA